MLYSGTFEVNSISNNCNEATLTRDVVLALEIALLGAWSHDIVVCPSKASDIVVLEQNDGVIGWVTLTVACSGILMRAPDVFHAARRLLACSLGASYVILLDSIEQLPRVPGSPQQHFIKEVNTWPLPVLSSHEIINPDYDGRPLVHLPIPRWFPELLSCDAASLVRSFRDLVRSLHE